MYMLLKTENFQTHQLLTTADMHAVQTDGSSTTVLCHSAINGRKLTLQIDSGATVNMPPARCLDDHQIRKKSFQFVMWNVKESRQPVDVR